MVYSLKTLLPTIGMIFTVIATLTCSKVTVDERKREDIMPVKTIEAVLKEHTDELMAMPGVVGTAQGLCDNKSCIKVYVVALTPELEQKIPKNLEGYTVDIEVTGEFRALPKN